MGLIWHKMFFFAVGSIRFEKLVIYENDRATAKRIEADVKFWIIVTAAKTEEFLEPERLFRCLQNVGIRISANHINASHAKKFAVGILWLRALIIVDASSVSKASSNFLKIEDFDGRFGSSDKAILDRIEI